jgi:hypothetical protein
VSRGGEDPDQAVRELLQKYEKEEAGVLRAELIAFLKSPECRAELEKTVQKPLEAIVLNALTGAKFQEQMRDAVLASLKPELVKAAQAAATSALAGIKVSLPEEAQKRMRVDAETALRDAFANAQRDALAAVPKMAGESRRQLQTQGDDRQESPRRERLEQRLDTNRVAPRLSGDSKFWMAAAAVVLILGSAGYWLFSRRGAETTDPGYVSDPPPVTETLSTDTAAQDPPPRRSALLEQYRAALSRMGPPNLAAPSEAQVACVESAINSAETASRLDVTILRRSLNNCAATNSRPSGASRIVAGVQAQLTEVARTRECGTLPPVTIDGKHGNETSRALKTYVGCTDPVGVPEALETLGDYAAVGVYFIDKRMRDAGTTTRR